jgi:hypothetical protein
VRRLCGAVRRAQVWLGAVGRLSKSQKQKVTCSQYSFLYCQAWGNGAAAGQSSYILQDKYPVASASAKVYFYGKRQALYSSGIQCLRAAFKQASKSLISWKENVSAPGRTCWPCYSGKKWRLVEKRVF